MILTQYEAKRIPFARTYVACIDLPRKPEATVLKLPFLCSTQCHGLVPWSVYVGFYPGAFLSTDATALCRRTSRSFLEGKVSNQRERPRHKAVASKYCAGVMKKRNFKTSPATAGASGWCAARFCFKRPSLVCLVLWR
jgi:hypothetical protein